MGTKLGPILEFLAGLMISMILERVELGGMMEREKERKPVMMKMVSNL